MSPTIATSRAALTLQLEHEAPSLILYNGHAGLGANLAGPLPDAPSDGQSLDRCKSESEGCAPEVNDEVLIAFERGQLRPPFVAAPLWNSMEEPPEGNAAAEIRHPDLQTRLPSLSDGVSSRAIPTTATPAPATTTRGDLDSYLNGLDEKLNSVGDDAQLANVDLQNWLQKQQQTLQMMSNICKMLYDTAMAVIRKIGG